MKTVKVAVLVFLGLIFSTSAFASRSTEQISCYSDLSPFSFIIEKDLASGAVKSSKVYLYDTNTDKLKFMNDIKLKTFVRSKKVIKFSWDHTEGTEKYNFSLQTKFELNETGMDGSNPYSIDVFIGKLKVNFAKSRHSESQPFVCIPN